VSVSASPSRGVCGGPLGRGLARGDQLRRRRGVRVGQQGAGGPVELGPLVAVGVGDSNAQAGHPSKGLMQCIDSTFNSYKLPDHNDIYNPVDNIIAGVRYTLGRYGSVANHPGLKLMAHGGAYQGY
jgi:SLT domain-containing protein